MQIKPLKQYCEPRYPTGIILDEHPELLAALPERWRVNPVVLATLAGSCLILAGLSGCRAKAAQNPCNPPVNMAGVTIPASYELSEVESRKIIVNEAKKRGIYFSPTKKKVKVTFPIPVSWQKSGGQKSADLEFELDGADVKHHISYEVVSKADSASWALKYQWFTDIDGFERSNTAQTINTELKKNKKEHYFIVATPESYDQKDAEEQLRKQVKDFIKWLKAEGAI